jgi:hypothetical protein
MEVVGVGTYRGSLHSLEYSLLIELSPKQKSATWEKAI